VSNTSETSFPPTKPVSHLVQKTNELDLKYRVLQSKPVAPVKVDRLEYLWYDPIFKEFLVNGFRYDFRIQFVGERCAWKSPNLKSALHQPDILV